MNLWNLLKVEDIDRASKTRNMSFWCYFWAFDKIWSIWWTIVYKNEKYDEIFEKDFLFLKTYFWVKIRFSTQFWHLKNCISPKNVILAEIFNFDHFYNFLKNPDFRVLVTQMWFKFVSFMSYKLFQSKDRLKLPLCTCILYLNSF